MEIYTKHMNLHVFFRKMKYEVLRKDSFAVIWCEKASKKQ